MNLKNQPPLFVPQQHRAEIEKLSKATLMDMVWDYADQLCGAVNDAEATMTEFRKRREIIMTYRRQDREG